MIKPRGKPAEPACPSSVTLRRLRGGVYVWTVVAQAASGSLDDLDETRRAVEEIDQRLSQRYGDREEER